jgi:hypothetical protein
MTSRKRLDHVIEPLARVSFPPRILCFDSESFVQKPATDDLVNEYSSTPISAAHVPRLICSEYVERQPDTGKYSDPPEARSFREDDFQTPDELCQAFWAYVSDKACHSERHSYGHTRLTLFAHNAGYDMLATGAYVHLPALGWTLEHPYSKGPVYIQRAKKGSHTIDILSSTNFFIAPLKQVAKDFGTVKLDFDKELFGKPVLTDAEKREQEIYCQRDTQIVRLAILFLIDFLASNNLGTWKPTISSIAFAAWRYRFMGHAVSVHTDPIAIALERASYNGGRTEAFCIDSLPGETHDFDVNNLYGSIMATKRVPTKLLEIRDDMTVSALRDMVVDDHTAVIAEVVVRIEAPALPVKSDKLLFPIGEFKTVLCSPELALAFELGTVSSVGRVAIYDDAPIFKTFVDYMSQKRVDAQLAGKKAERTLYKAMTNHVYGKFGQMSEEWERIRDRRPDEPLGQRHGFFQRPDGRSDMEVVQLVMPGGVYQWDGHKVESFNAFPAIAAFITSYARVRLWRLMDIANGPDGRHVFYCDTDSLFTDRVGRDRLEAAGEVHETQLGKVKHEWEAVLLRIQGAKWYDAFIAHEQHAPGLDKDGVCFKGWRFTKNGQAADDVATTEPHMHHLERRKGVPANAVPVTLPNGEPGFAYAQFPLLNGHLAMPVPDAGHYHNRNVLKKGTVSYDKARKPEGAIGWYPPFRLPDDAVGGLVAAELAA